MACQKTDPLTEFQPENGKWTKIGDIVRVDHCLFCSCVAPKYGFGTGILYTLPNSSSTTTCNTCQEWTLMKIVGTTKSNRLLIFHSSSHHIEIPLNGKTKFIGSIMKHHDIQMNELYLKDHLGQDVSLKTMIRRSLHKVLFLVFVFVFNRCLFF